MKNTYPAVTSGFEFHLTHDVVLKSYEAVEAVCKKIVKKSKPSLLSIHLAKLDLSAHGYGLHESHQNSSFWEVTYEWKQKDNSLPIKGSLLFFENNFIPTRDESLKRFKSSLHKVFSKDLGSERDWNERKRMGLTVRKTDTTEVF